MNTTMRASAATVFGLLSCLAGSGCAAPVEDADPTLGPPEDVAVSKEALIDFWGSVDSCGDVTKASDRVTGWDSDDGDDVSQAREDEITDMFAASEAPDMLASIHCKRTLCRLQLRTGDRLNPQIQRRLVGKLGREVAPLSVTPTAVEALIPFDPDGLLPRI